MDSLSHSNLTSPLSSICNVNKMLRRVAGFSAVIALSCQSLIARADTIVTYDYTGVDFSNAGPDGFFGAGPRVTGTITFDLAAANTTQSSGTVASGNFRLVNDSGSALGIPPPSGVLVSITAQFQNNVTYSSCCNSYDQELEVRGNTSGTLTTFAGMQLNSSADHIFSSFSFGPTATGPGYDANGLPIPFSRPPQTFPATDLTDTAQFSWTPAVGFSDNNGQFAIDSLTLAPVPLPAAVWFLLSGLGGLGVFSRFRRTA